MCKRETFGEKGYDKCISPIIKALNDNNIETVGSCCGHGEFPGLIELKNGRWLIIAKNEDSFKRKDNKIVVTEITNTNCIKAPTGLELLSKIKGNDSFQLKGSIGGTSFKGVRSKPHSPCLQTKPKGQK